MKRSQPAKNALERRWGVRDGSMVQRRRMNTQRKALPFCLDLVSLSGCMPHANRNVTECDRTEVVNDAVQVILEY
eukprot:7445563-Pyramimonas_sp.AAC.1